MRESGACDATTTRSPFSAADANVARSHSICVSPIPPPQGFKRARYAASGRFSVGTLESRVSGNVVSFLDERLAASLRLRPDRRPPRVQLCGVQHDESPPARELSGEVTQLRRRGFRARDERRLPAVQNLQSAFPAFDVQVVVPEAVRDWNSASHHLIDHPCHEPQIRFVSFSHLYRRLFRSSRNERGDVVVVHAVDQVAQVDDARHRLPRFWPREVPHRLADAIRRRAEPFHPPRFVRTLVVLSIRVLRVREQPDREQGLRAHHVDARRGPEVVDPRERRADGQTDPRARGAPRRRRAGRDPRASAEAGRGPQHPARRVREWSRDAVKETPVVSHGGVPRFSSTSASKATTRWSLETPFADVVTARRAPALRGTLLDPTAMRAFAHPPRCSPRARPESRVASPPRPRERAARASPSRRARPRRTRVAPRPRERPDATSTRLGRTRASTPWTATSPTPC